MNIPDDQDDLKLVILLYQGDTNSYEQIFSRYWYAMFKIANARLKSTQDAEEVVQDVFTSLWKNRSRAVIENLSHYLFSAVGKRCLNKIRSRLTDQRYREYYLHVFNEVEDDTRDRIDLNLLTEAMDHILHQLPEKSQQVFRLNRLHGYTVPEISAQMNTPIRTVEYHLAKALRVLRVALRDFMISLTIGAAFMFLQ